MTAVALALYLATAVAFVVVLAPIVVVLVISFSSVDSFAFPPPGLSLRWYRDFFGSEGLTGAFAFSLEIGVVSSLAASLLGTLGALFVGRERSRSGPALQGMFLAPLVFPTIILGLALLIFFRAIGMPSVLALVVAHILIGVPYCFRSTLASLLAFDRAIEEAAASLGAGPIRTFVLVTLPLVWPGVVAGGLFAFIVSFGEVNADLFLTGPGATTLPIEVLSHLQFPGDQLVIAAASAIQVALIVVAVVIIERIVGFGRLVRR
ncbi:MAG TPA: ABC transporter permease [Thermodesulfobacteriota bacterium]